MNDSKHPRITLKDIRHISVETLIKLDITQLRSLEEEADKELYAAGTQLEWVRGIITKKLRDTSISKKSAS